MELIITGRPVDSEEALRIGLANEVVPDGQALPRALALAREIAGHSRRATRHVKRLMDLAGRVDLAEGFQAEQDAMGELVGSPEQVAVVERRLAGR
jgi:enoyl-CoA hydratase/carnithine racemase